MKKPLAFSILFSLIFVFLCPLISQEEKSEKTYSTYNPAGRRDPFRDLLSGREIAEKVAVEGKITLSVDDIVLIGISKARGKFIAIINGPQGFPYFIKENDKFANGFVLSIKEFQVTFRKIKERGIPLRKPKDIIKVLHPEE
ncbi:MAG: hypothetical protein ACETWK_04360 [Candidatus Aminicenantaceae bacterium]